MITSVDGQLKDQLYLYSSSVGSRMFAKFQSLVSDSDVSDNRPVHGYKTVTACPSRRTLFESFDDVGYRL